MCDGSVENHPQYTQLGFKPQCPCRLVYCEGDALDYVATYASDALRCWKCDSSYDPMCGDPFNTTHRTLIDCESERSQSSYAANHAYCKKTKESENNRQSLISRACVWANEGSKNTICSSPSSPYRKQEHCSICETDGCNGSPGTMVPSLISCLAPAMLWFVIKGR
uniref:Protein sleepless n=1 Tax=Timema monikensis TaxID=170555 RepID=A0A7R9EIP3_9NEOP|nr:unnamed protein product [Timema monikensis]